MHSAGVWRLHKDQPNTVLRQNVASNQAIHRCFTDGHAILDMIRDNYFLIFPVFYYTLCKNPVSLYLVICCFLEQQVKMGRARNDRKVQPCFCTNMSKLSLICQTTARVCRSGRFENANLGKHEEWRRIPLEVIDLEDGFWVWQIKLLQVAIQACAGCAEIRNPSTDTQSSPTHAHNPLGFPCSSQVSSGFTITPQPLRPVHPVTAVQQPAGSHNARAVNLSQHAEVSGNVPDYPLRFYWTSHTEGHNR